MEKGKGLLLILAGVMITGLSVVKGQVLVESVAAIVGNEVVYLSDIENLAIDMKRNGNRLPVDQQRCIVLNELLVSRLFLDQARIDSITVTEDMVENEVTMNINGAIQRAGTEKVQLSIIQLDPPGMEENKAEARQKLLDIRSEILAGKSFNVLAVMYSEDPGPARNSDELGYTVRGSLEKEYADAASSLTKNTVSRIVETRYGFHIIQLIDRKGDLINTRHILIKPKVKPEQTIKATSTLDSLANQIRKESISFGNAA